VFGVFSWITLRPSAAAAELNKVEQDKTERAGTSKPGCAICDIHRRKPAGQHGPTPIRQHAARAVFHH